MRRANAGSAALSAYVGSRAWRNVNSAAVNPWSSDLHFLDRRLLLPTDVGHVGFRSFAARSAIINVCCAALRPVVSHCSVYANSMVLRRWGADTIAGADSCISDMELCHRVNGSFGSSFTTGSPDHRVIILTRCETRNFPVFEKSPR